MAQVVSKKCAVCEENNSKLLCYECNQELCEMCRPVHDKFSANKQHTIVDNRDVTCINYAEKLKCITHDQENRCFCLNCNSLICAECVIDEHKSHDVKSIKTMAHGYRMDLSKTELKVKAEMEMLLNLKSRIKNKKKTLSEAFNLIERDLKSSIDDVQNIVKGVADEYIATTKTHLIKQEDMGNFELHQVEMTENVYETFLKTLTELKKEKHDGSFVTRFMWIQDDIENLKEMPSVQPEEGFKSFERCEFLSAISNAITSRRNLQNYNRLLEEIWSLKTENKHALKKPDESDIPEELLNSECLKHFKVLIAVKNVLKSIHYQEAEIQELIKTIKDLKEELESKDLEVKTSQHEIQAKYKSVKDLEEQIKEANDFSQSLAEENERISELLKLPEEKTKMKVTTLQKKVKEESKHMEDLQQQLQEQEKKADDLSRIHDNRIKEIAKMSITIGELEKSNQDLEDQIKSFQSKNVSIKKVETQLKEAEDKIQTLIEENDRIQAKYKSFKDLEEQIIEATDLSQSLAEENERISELLKLPEEKTKMKVTTLQKKVKEERRHKEDLQQQLQEQKKKADDLSQMCDKYKAAYQKTKQTQDERLVMQRPQTAPSKQYREMQVMVEKLKGEKESLMQKLSKVAGMKMKDNNPAIADLSDPNRPEKLSEKFREIYDNAWTNLLDTITEKTGESDDIVVKQIVSALMMMYDTCKNTITNNKREIAKLVGYSEDCFDKPYAGGKEGQDPVLKTLKDLIQVSVTRQMVAVIKNIKEFPEIKTILQVGGKNGEAFITECLQLCLYMCTQDPPVVLDFSCKSGDAFNKDKFTPFTKSGSVVDYVVWPVMYLSNNGAIMSKGIAQGK